MASLNKVILIGNCTADIELKKTQTGISVCSFNIGVSRRFKNADGKYDTDFIAIVAWKSTAEFCARYFGRGAAICIVGSLQQRSYTKGDQKHTVVEVIADEVSFVDKKSETPAAKQEIEEPSKQKFAEPAKGGFEDLADTEDLPF